jgi:hypothetical protein
MSLTVATIAAVECLEVRHVPGSLAIRTGAHLSPSGVSAALPRIQPWIPLTATNFDRPRRNQRNSAPAGRPARAPLGKRVPSATASKLRLAGPLRAASGRLGSCAWSRLLRGFHFARSCTGA